MARTKNIKRFLSYPGNFTDQRLAEVYAHCQDGKLCFLSCCCLIGTATADHPLRSRSFGFLESHLRRAKTLPFAWQAEDEYYRLGGQRFLFWILWPGFTSPPLPVLDDFRRRRRLLPLLKAEIDRRAALRRKEDELWFVRECLKIGKQEADSVSPRQSTEVPR